MLVWLSRARYYFFVRYEGAADDYNVHTTEARVRLLRAIRIKMRVNSLMIRRKAKKKERESAVCKEAFVPLLYTRVQRERRTAGRRELSRFSPFRDCRNRVTVSISVFYLFLFLSKRDSVNA